MKYIRILAVGFLATVGSIGFSQRAIFNLPDVFTGKLSPANLAQLQWVGQTHDYVYVKNGNLMKATAPNHDTTVWVRLSDLNKALEKAGEKTVKSFPNIAYWVDKNSFYFRSGERIMCYHIEEKKVDKMITLPEDAENVQIDYNKVKVSCTVGNDLCAFLLWTREKVA
jgi:hypothetical protein